jgi:hypothetical protein
MNYKVKPMKSLKKRIENLNDYINSNHYPAGTKMKIGAVSGSIASGRLTKTLDESRDARTTENIKSHIL